MLKEILAVVKQKLFSEAGLAEIFLLLFILGVIFGFELSIFLVLCVGIYLKFLQLKKDEKL